MTTSLLVIACFGHLGYTSTERVSGSKSAPPTRQTINRQRKTAYLIKSCWCDRTPRRHIFLKGKRGGQLSVKKGSSLWQRPHHLARFRFLTLWIGRPEVFHRLRHQKVISVFVFAHTWLGLPFYCVIFGSSSLSNGGGAFPTRIWVLGSKL